jgi:glycosyltransferase involved in cell wall biosynthesis
MRHLFVCREYPPVSGGGIGSYTERIATLLAERDEVVHVVSQLWKGADRPLERRCDGRLLIHRVPCERASRRLGLRPHKRLRDATGRALFASAHHAQAFGWLAGLLVERLVEEGAVDVIEAPEYEASLYFLQLRRALGHGPAAKPPCVIHLHSPTELIARHNNWDVGHPYFLTAKRLEDFSMSAADVLLCPSHYLADEISSRSDLGCAPPHVIHYPVPGWEPSKDSVTPNSEGPVVYVGRLERRKGFLEWIDAAVAAARLRPDARFEFVGRAVLDSDWRASRDLIRDRIPEDVADRFLFHGSRGRVEVQAILSRARLAAVPSRWDNFPNTCLEAMSVGVPVLATRNGGMVQLVDDGVSGWLSASSEAADLHVALMRALDTSPPRLKEMGRNALEAVRTRCDPDRVVEAHLDFKRALVANGAERSLNLPPVLGAFAAKPDEIPTAPRANGGGVGVVVVCPARTSPDRLLAGLASQTTPPTATVVAPYSPSRLDEAPPSGRAWPEVRIIEEVQPQRASAIKAGVAALKDVRPQPLGIVILDEHDVLDPRHLERCGGVLAECPEVGLVSFWERGDGQDLMRPCPARPYQWLWNDAASASVVRTVALTRISDLPTLEDPLYDRWYVANAVLDAGWVGVTIPETLAERSHPPGWVDRLDSTQMVQAIHEPFGHRIAEDAAILVLVARSGFAGALRSSAFRPREFSELAALLASEWRRAVGWGWRKVMRSIGRG